MKTDSRQPPPRARFKFDAVWWVCRAVAVVLAAAQSYLARHAMNSDGMAYLDASDYLARGDFYNAVNALWSPLYPVLLWLMRSACGVAPDNEFACAHLLNFVIYLFALIAFEQLWRRILAASKRTSDAALATTDRVAFLTATGVIVAGYAVFIWAMLVPLGLVLVTPDVLVTVFLFAASAVLLDIEREPFRHRRFAWLGAWLGLGFLAKAPMLPIGAVIVGLAVWRGAGARSRCLTGGLLAATVMLCCAAPYVAVLSHRHGRLTFGESARLNYLWHVNQVSTPHFYTANQVRLEQHINLYGAPQQATRRLVISPPVFEFNAPFDVTHAPWFDPTYFYEGMQPRFEMSAQMTVVRRNLARYAAYVGFAAALPLGLLLLCLWRVASDRLRDCWRRLLTHSLLIISAAGQAMYLLVNTEHRYLAPLWVLLFVALLDEVKNIPARFSKHIESAFIIVVVIVLLTVSLVAGQFRTASRAAVVQQHGISQVLRRVPHPRRQLAVELRHAGLEVGAPVAVIGDGRFAYWARLGRWRIVAEVPFFDNPDYQPSHTINQFWHVDDIARQQAIEKLIMTGAHAIVCESVPPDATPAQLAGWQRLTPQSNGYVYFPPRRNGKD